MVVMKDPLYNTWQGWVELAVLGLFVSSFVVALLAFFWGLTRPAYWAIVGGAVLPWLGSILILLLVGSFSKGQREAIMLLTVVVPMLGIIATLVISSIATLFVPVSASAKVAGLRAFVVSGAVVSFITIAVSFYFKDAYVSSMEDFLPSTKNVSSTK